MNIPAPVIDCITNANAKALATNGPAGLNVVPVSVISVSETEIKLFDFFMNKTTQNLTEPNTPVALTCWDGFLGVQIRAEATYHTEGEVFLQAQTDMMKQFPERTLRGVLVLIPTAYYDVSATSEAAGKRLYA